MSEPSRFPDAPADFDVEAAVRVEQRGAARWITLDRPTALNALNAPMLERMSHAVESAQADEAVRVVVLTGTGPAFSAGADMESLRVAPQHPQATMDGAHRLVRAVVSVDVPVVAAVNGVAAGVACSAALAADLVVAAESAAFLLPFTRLGLMTDGGSSASIVAAIGRARTMRMALLGEPLPAADALAAGLITHLAPDAELESLVTSLAERLAAGPALAQTAIKRAVNATALPAFEQALDRESSGQQALFRTRDFGEGLAAFAERRRPVFRGE
ncbi:enoyl-CoA hydratase/isomerase family protein [Nocardioides sp. TRM66260-LWL]|uniref:enoyl-CoA hydratase-related protein n=1 Tax=Nocardioides sp. TRM66260-LWL TaxID=2874478 RepID=UPI001CC63ACC|nr:enoyl-CoA hydratase-related protein [Nocardioides sp. TRM66260-LWL]MBZ5732938.1 enoyl-CoA hydratase/isomerase family protein [Nocardioides sp. TRM66260-LWL]